MGFLDNCRPNERFEAERAFSYSGGPTIWFCVDWDRRRCISASVPEEFELNLDLSGCEDVMERIYQGLSEVVDGLDDDVNLVNFSIDGNLISTSSKIEDDDVLSTLYCPVDMIPGLDRTGVRCVPRADLVEVDRLSPCVDLVTYRSKPRSKGLFKYAFSHTDVLRNWHELNYWLRLSSQGNQHIVPLEYVVTDYQDVPGYRNNVQVVVGFTSVFFPGMTLQDLQKKPSWLFKFEYLRQLFDVVNDLHLIRGIVHRDIAPRNLLINPETGELQIFNFSCAGKLGYEGAGNNRNFRDDEGFGIDLIGVAATVYEIVTGDTQLAEQARLDEDISTIMDKGWTRSPSLRLDGEVSDYQDTIRDWLQWRIMSGDPWTLITHYTQAVIHIDWPDFWEPEITSLDRHGNANGEGKSTLVWRTALKALGLKFVEWKRPAQNNIPNSYGVLGDGTLISQRPRRRRATY
ncbi:hypothetical protein SLS63_006128 [Diaporthe eres]|uniref:EKC/KEOPS complex subunit BUD32 n=1 Tax=Diaporthe eres TaxID=83184 RepID=A0ABR1P9H3_DIAER